MAGVDARRAVALGRGLRLLLRAIRRGRRPPRRPALRCDAVRRARARSPPRGLLHIATVACLFAAGFGLPVGAFYWLGVAAVAALLGYEHLLVRPGDLRRLDAAFFTMNGVISVAFAVCVIVDATT